MAGTHSQEFLKKTEELKAAARTGFHDQRARERVRRLQRARARRDAIFKPGDFVNCMRRTKGLHDKSREHGMKRPRMYDDGTTRPRMYGVRRVLATETTHEGGQRRPRHIVWITYGGYLIRAAPNQLEYASERNRQLAELDGTLDMPWTVLKG